MAATRARRARKTPSTTRPTREPALRIRRGTARDVETILRLIRGLADYEKLTHEAKATRADIRRDGFGARRYFETLICSRGREPIGFALYFFTYSTFVGRPSIWLEDLFVRPEVRGAGLGRALLLELAGIARDRGCGRFEWAVLDWNASAIGFYQKQGAVILPDWRIARVAGPALETLAGQRGGRRAGEGTT